MSVVERISDVAHETKGTTIASAPYERRHLHEEALPSERKSLREPGRSHRHPYESERSPSRKQGRRDRTDDSREGSRSRILQPRGIDGQSVRREGRQDHGAGGSGSPWNHEVDRVQPNHRIRITN